MGGGSVEKQIQKALGSLPPCGNRCRFSESAICSSRVHPPSEIKSNLKIAILGKPNTGKSTFINAVIKENRLKVSDIPGTTKDAIYIPFMHKNENLCLIDTAGLRKNKISNTSLEQIITISDVCDNFRPHGIEDVPAFLLEKLPSGGHRPAGGVAEASVACAIKSSRIELWIWELICLYSLVLFKSSSLVGKMRRICAETFSEAPPKYCARIVPHKFCTISAHFLVPPRMFRTHFRGPLGTILRTNFAQFSQTCGMFLNSAAVQANTVWLKLLPAVLLFLRIYFSPNCRYRYRLEIRTNFHYRYRLGVRSHPFISIDSQLPSWKSFELIFPKLPLLFPSCNVFELER